MDPTPGPVLRRRQAGTRLRQLRETAGKSLNDVAGYLDCSAAKISRIETGRLPARIPDVRNMLDLYDVGEPQRTELLDLVRESREKGWWHAYPELRNEEFDTFLGLEDSATEIRDYTCYLVPGLLQTTEYAYAVQAHRVDIDEKTAERYIEVRMTRQAILTRPHPPKLSVILDESVLHRAAALGPVTGQQQLDHLLRSAQETDITLQVLTYGAGIASHVSFTVFGFADPGDPKVVYLDGLTGSWYESKTTPVAHYTLTFDGLRSIALSPEKSISFIAALSAGCR